MAIITHLQKLEIQKCMIMDNTKLFLQMGSFGKDIHIVLVGNSMEIQ
jgi:hypothetical protein